MLLKKLTARPTALAIGATAFRDDRSAVQVMILELSFDGCQISSSARFAVGERLRLHQRGQGLIETKVTWAVEGEARLNFETEPKV